jgi:2-methylisocitrate lyase-like PEP mutase family enzyme
LAARLRELHRGFLVLPNAWDVASARAVVEAGFPVVATSSAAVARSLGYDDHEDMPPDEAFAAVARIGHAVDVPVTADLEAGYGLSPDELVARLAAADAVGCNIEDTDHRRGGLADASSHAARLRAIKEAEPDIVLNARVDVFLRAEEPDIGEGLRRAKLYAEAGADCVYPIGLADEELIARFVREAGAPVNVMIRPGAPALARLRELGVARVSYAGGVFRDLQARLRARLDEIAKDVG